MSLHYLVKHEMLIAHMLPLSYYRNKLQNLSHLNRVLQIRQTWIQLITACGKYCKRRCTKHASLIWSYQRRHWFSIACMGPRRDIYKRSSVRSRTLRHDVACALPPQQTWPCRLCGALHRVTAPLPWLVHVLGHSVWCDLAVLITWQFQTLTENPFVHPELFLMLSYRFLLYCDICIVSLKYFFYLRHFKLDFFTLHYTDKWLPQWWHDTAWLTPFSIAVSVHSDQWCVLCTSSLAIVPHAVINWIQIWQMWGPLLRWNKFWSFFL